MRKRTKQERIRKKIGTAWKANSEKARRGKKWNRRGEGERKKINCRV